MQSFNEQIQRQIFSHLIETILYCRLSGKSGIMEEIKAVMEKLQGGTDGKDVRLDVAIEMISKIHEGSEFRVGNVLRKHFEDHHSDKYSIYLQIFTLLNKKPKQQNSSHFYQSQNQLTQKWVFNKNSPQRRRLSVQKKDMNSDLFFHILGSIKEILQTQSLNINNTTAVDNNNKSYQIVIRSKCSKKEKYVTHVFHHQRNNHQPSLHTMHMKTSLLELEKYWEKTLFIDHKSNVTVGCYLAKKTSKQLMKTYDNLKQLPQSVDAAFLRQPDRKLSSQTKAQDKQKSSSSSFKFSLGLGDFPFSLNLNLNKGLKYSSAEISSVNKGSDKILHQNRPRYQSIYESRDEQMNIFILSPRKLSDQESPKAKHLQQKTIKFEIGNHHDHFTRGISEEVIQEFVLEPDQNVSNVSSDGFEMLWDEGQGEHDKVKEECQQHNLTDLKNKNEGQNILFEEISKYQATLIEMLKSLDNLLLFI